MKLKYKKWERYKKIGIYIHKMNSLTFVTVYMNIYETPFMKKDTEWRFQRFRKIASLGIPICIFCSPDCMEIMEEFIKEYPNIKIINYMTLQDTWTYKLCNSVENLEMPNNRNLDKDIRDYIILMNTKTEFLKYAIDANPWNSTHFAWIDFNIYHIFQRESYVNQYLTTLSKRTLPAKFITFPGCWDKHYTIMEYLINDICWRFCGGFFLGDKESILELDHLYRTFFPEFLETTKKLVWEVNFWAYLENQKGWNPTWYYGDHNEQIIEISGDVCSRSIESFSNHIKYEYPSIVNFLPTSTAYIFHNGKHIINTRYVNYWLYPCGSYLIYHTERHLYTKNIVSELNPETFHPLAFKEMDETSISLEKHGGSIYGLEDIRLYEFGNEIRFIATNVEYSSTGKNSMVRGKYDADNGIYSDCVVLTPPTLHGGCEKNWIPIVKENTEYFIYKWSPFKIGTVHTETNQLNIDIVWNHDTPFFNHVRGSTCFVETEAGLLGLVHFSEEKHPRHYFHILVLLDKQTFRPLKYSENFYFHQLSIEFCVGFTIKNEKYHFWISNFDRDPEMVIIDPENIPLCFDFVIQENN